MPTAPAQSAMAGVMGGGRTTAARTVEVLSKPVLHACAIAGRDAPTADQRAGQRLESGFDPQSGARDGARQEADDADRGGSAGPIQVTEDAGVPKRRKGDASERIARPCSHHIPAPTSGHVEGLGKRVRQQQRLAVTHRRPFRHRHRADLIGTVEHRGLRAIQRRTPSIAARARAARARARREQALEILATRGTGSLTFVRRTAMKEQLLRASTRQARQCHHERDVGMRASLWPGSSRPRRKQAPPAGSHPPFENGARFNSLSSGGGETDLLAALRWAAAHGAWVPSQSWNSST